jgi:hypothetical protein
MLQDPYPMEKNPDEILMFMRFVEHELALPARNFFNGLLEYYGIASTPTVSSILLSLSIFAKLSWGLSPTRYSSESSSA